ncbi:autotransporter outer membrane beta-barrel domain-containing protein [Amaricoccus sp.]|uniref:autotransporter outer membrane beta-barrel domain-containing protein n=1 Tax=Amaricoccus sp. TaxID=1872485 RepID=UPI002605614D|nr:autotransporter outer membrane beta-barrel domain-containing protein [uncultured Amaricoccus sp.]
MGARDGRAWRRAVWLLLAAGLIAGPARAAKIEDLVAWSLEKNAAGALAVLGISAVPSETASALIVNTGTRPRDGSDFQAAQLGGGFTWSEAFPLYLEGYIGYNRYVPSFVLTEGQQSSRFLPKWTGVAATGGIGWDVRLGENLVIRPMLNVTLGQIASDTAFVAAFIADRLDADELHFVRDGGLTAGGLGGSLVLAYDRSFANDVQVDWTLRYTNIHLKPIAGDRGVVASADAETLAFWSRLRLPTDWQAFGRPIRSVSEFSASWLPGDQGDILNTDWLAQIGFGYEIDVSETSIPWITKGRAMFRYTRGDVLEGWGLGLAVSF